MPVPTGSETLDSILDGGLPENRTVLVTGGPGTGKSTLAMQFLAEGLARDEDCLYISTEQTFEELDDAFADFAFDLEHENLTVTSLHATPGQTVDSGDERELTLETLEGGKMLGGDYSAPFESKYITQYLERFAPADRVVLDSVSGLSAIGEDQDTFRRTLLDFIRLLNDEFGATALFTAEESQPDVSQQDVKTVAASDAVQFNTHGVLRLWRENVGGDYHRFIEVVKMRGVDHDTRVHEITFTHEGLRISPRLRTHPGEFVPSDHMSTGIDGLDHLMGGGIVKGGTLLLEHDGQASPHSILTNLLVQSHEAGMPITIIPPVELPPKRLRTIIDERIGDMEEMLADDDLFLVDFANIWENTKRNVFKPQEHDTDNPAAVFRTIDDRRGDRPMFSALNVEAQLPVLSDDELRQIRFWEEENLYRPGDTSLYLFNPATLDDELAAFYENGAWQTLETWVTDKGLQYIELQKSPSGFMGSTRLVEYIEREPYMRVQQPPGAGSAESTLGDGGR
ncbi:ATPase domain-containing protein [Haloarcula laminariae]|uniref:ATPase domain-containing protein n=1 Tax=Haloarcula laminariae TaxID=2961577 RepID=UPI0021C9E5A4|nr:MULTISPECIES: ATPase domain-containing protein [Halomicroarcula]